MLIILDKSEDKAKNTPIDNYFNEYFFSFFMVGSLKKGADQIVRVCMGLQPGERFLVVSEKKKRPIVDAVLGAAKQICGSVEDLYVDDFGSRPIQKIPDAVCSAFKKADASIVILDKLPGELSTLRTPLKQLGLKYTRHANCPGLDEKIMRTGMSVDHTKVREFTNQVFGVVSVAKTITIQTALGTDLTFTLNSRYKWMNSNADYRNRPQTGTNLPGAEVFTYPESVEGVAVIDGVLGDYFSKKYGLISNTPLTLKIKSGRIIDSDCDNKELLLDFRNYIKTDDDANRIGELGIGTNIFIKELIGVMLQDEKFPGAHIAAGHGYPAWTGSPYNSKVHCDMVMQDVSIQVDGKPIMESGKYII